MEIIKNAEMGKYCSFKCGGKAKILYIPENIEELKSILKKVKDDKHFIIGNGTNVLVKDKGFNGSIIKIGNKLNNIRIEGNNIIAEAGCSLSYVSSVACDNSLGGFEFACGIPGNVGGSLYMNAGAYGSEMGKVVSSAKVLTMDGKIKTYSNEDLKFDYRYCIINETKEIVIEVCFALKPKNKDEIKNEMDILTKKRHDKQPLNYPSAGSVFKRPIGAFAGQLIEEAGLKGKSIGGAEISTLHANFIINKNNATVSDIIKLIKYVQQKVFENSNVMLEQEIIVIGKD